MVGWLSVLLEDQWLPGRHRQPVIARRHKHLWHTQPNQRGQIASDRGQNVAGHLPDIQTLTRPKPDLVKRQFFFFPKVWQFADEGVLLHLPMSKTDQFCVGHDIPLSPSWDSCCLIHALRTLFEHYPKSATEPLFSTSCGPSLRNGS